MEIELSLCKTWWGEGVNGSRRFLGSLNTCRHLLSSLPLTQQGSQLRKSWLFPCNILGHSFSLLTLNTAHQIVNVLQPLLIYASCSIWDKRLPNEACRAPSYHLARRQLYLCFYHPCLHPTPKYSYIDFRCTGWTSSPHARQWHPSSHYIMLFCTCLPLVTFHFIVILGSVMMSVSSLLESPSSKFCLMILLAVEGHYLDPLFHCIIKDLITVKRYYISF